MRIDSQLTHNNISATSTASAAAPWKLGDPSSFQDLFSGNLAASTAPAVAAAPAPTAPSVAPAVFVPQVQPQAVVVEPAPTFEQTAAVIGPDGTASTSNPMEMATQQTADDLAAKLGGTVVDENFAGGFTTSAPIRDISFAGSNVTINAGLAASLFAMYGDAPGSQAWQTINNDLGRDPSATGPVG